MGFGKRSPISHYTPTKRGSKGVITLKTTKRNGHLSALMLVRDEDDLMIITQEGMIIRQKVSEISQVSRNTQGVRLINLTADDLVRDISIVPAEPDDETLDKEVETLLLKPTPNLTDLKEAEDMPETDVEDDVSEEDTTDDTGEDEE